MQISPGKDSGEILETLETFSIRALSRDGATIIQLSYRKWETRMGNIIDRGRGETTL